MDLNREQPRTGSCAGKIIASLTASAGDALGRMFRNPDEGFAFTVRRAAGCVGPTEGISPRYTAITLLGLRSESREVVAQALRGSTCEDVLARLIERVRDTDNLGDAALTTWAARRYNLRSAAMVGARMSELLHSRADHPTVEFAWVLDALCEMEATQAVEAQRRTVASGLMAAQNAQSGLWPHHVGAGARGRAHVGCFADQVYPIHALANYSRRTGHKASLSASESGAAGICELQGRFGQWWWHYDVRTRRTLDPYPVYSVHQHAMAPMALRALREAGGHDWNEALLGGVDWLASAPEIGGRSLIDPAAGFAWRKVGRREPSKLTRRLQAVASALHPSLRVPCVDRVFPPNVVDYECRPYEIGWMLYAWRQGQSC